MATNKSDQKRPRACDPCHAIKIKCELGSIGGPGPCERCTRLGKDCVITPPKSQKDRVAELEAQVATLTKLLESQKISVPPGAATIPTTSSDSNALNNPGSRQPLPQKKRRLDPDAGPDEDSPDFNRIQLDAVISQDVQKKILRRYIHEIMPGFPLIPITGDPSYDALRQSRPLLLQAIVYAACPGMISIESQEEISQLIMKLFASAAVADGKKSVELIQALQVGVLFFRSPKSHSQVSVFQLAQICEGMAEDLGLGGPDSSPSLGHPHVVEQISTEDVQRTWLVCHLLSSSMALLMRRRIPREFSEHEEAGLLMLGYSQYSLPSDKLLCQYVRAERLCERMASQLDFSNFKTANDVSDPSTQATLQGLQNAFIDWKAQIPAGLHCTGLVFWEHIATLYLHESVLHTSTNKQSFAAPFVAERLSVTDFPTPLITPEHITSIHALKAACHALLDHHSSFDTSTLVALPAVLFASRVAYALYILVKLYIATTAIGNTFGAFLDPESLQVEQYLKRSVRVAMMVREVDERCGQARILSSTSRLREWFLNYKMTTFQQEFKQATAQGVVHDYDYGYPNVSSSSENTPSSWDTSSYEDDNMWLGLDTLFADPQLVEWNAEQLPTFEYQTASVQSWQ